MVVLRQLVRTRAAPGSAWRSVMRGREATAVGELTGCPPSTPQQTARPVRGSLSRSSAYSFSPACSYSAPQSVERREDRLEHLTATVGLRNGHIPGPSRALSTILSGSRHDASPTCAMDSAPSGARYRPLTPGPAPRERAVLAIAASSRSRARPLRAPGPASHGRILLRSAACLPASRRVASVVVGAIAVVAAPHAAGVAPVWLVIVPVDVLAPPASVPAARQRRARRGTLGRTSFGTSTP